jgi:DNA polymerase III gamma/tau subunit
MITKDDVRKMIKEIFDLQAIPGEKTFYILEEVHLLGKNQDMLLEELERIPEDTHVIMCTTNYNEILDTLKTRAQLKLNFKRLTTTECRILIDRLEREYNVNGLSAADKSFLASVTNCNAREITNFLQTFDDSQDLGTLMRNYFSKVSAKVYIETIEALFRDFPNFIIFLQDLESTLNIVDMWSGFHEFIRDAVFYMYGGSVTLFNNHEKHQISEVFTKIPQEKISKLYKHTIKQAKTQLDAEDNLIVLRDIMNESSSITQRTMRAQAVEENTIATKNAAMQTSETHKVEVTKPDLQSLNNMTTHNFTYDLNIDF